MPTDTQNLSVSTIPALPEYLQYAVEVEQSLSHMEEKVHYSNDPEQIIMYTLKAATEFYDGDWAGIMEADLSMKVWSTLWWYNRKTDGMTPSLLDDFEDGEYLAHWFESISCGTPVIISNVEDLKDSSPQEYAFLKHNLVHSILAVPFWRKPSGYLIVRNPKRYTDRDSMLKMMAYVAVSSVNEKRLLDRLRRRTTPAIIQSERDIIINLFGELQIITMSGMITEKDINSQQIIRLIAYLLLHKARPASACEIFNDLWPEEDSVKAQKRIRNLVYRTQQLFGPISKYRLIEFTVSGYRINPELRVYSDCRFFEECWHNAQLATTIKEKASILKKAIEMYKEGLCSDFYGVPWFAYTESHYSMRYEGIINQLLSILSEVADYGSIHQYANNALRLLPGSSTVYYWLIYSIQHLGAIEIARSELKAAKHALTEADYQDLISRLQKNGLHI